MQSVQDIAQAIVAREGGYVNDPDDPGGATNFGVTLATMRRLGLDVDGDNQITVSDVKALSAADAERIFLKHYYAAPGIANLPATLQASVFDMYVNAGASAVKILQKLFNDMGLPVTVDGVIGPETIAAARRAQAMAPDHLADAYGIARRNYYYALGDRRAGLRKFARRLDGGKGGWILRAEEFISPRFHLSDRQHRQRVAKWA
ncbi:MAG: peptidoglycan-binding protein [Rhodobacteraceae bacterium]|nr:peptidoglycan-binding protein [Paracoccaceae bacterium]